MLGLNRGRGVSDNIRGITVTNVVTNVVRTLVTLWHYHNLGGSQRAGAGAGQTRGRLTARGEVSVGEGGPEISLLVIVILIL